MQLRLDMPGMADRLTANFALAALHAMAWSCRFHPALRNALCAQRTDGQLVPITIGLNFTTRDERRQVWARIAQKRLRVGRGKLDAADVTVIFRNEQYMRSFFWQEGETDVLGWLLFNHMTFDGNLACLAKFAQVASAVRTSGRALERASSKPWPTDAAIGWEELAVRRAGERRPVGAATGALHLHDPAFSHLTLDDFPRLKKQLHGHLHTRPRICTERAALFTEAALREREHDPDQPAVLRQARIFAHVMRGKTAIVREDDLLLGTTTRHPVGVIIFPELGGTAIWPELLTMQARDLNPYEISSEDIGILDQRVFPFWIRSNIREWTRERYGNPDCLRLDERWVLYFLWKNHAISHTIADLPTVLQRGLRAIADQARDRQASASDPTARAFHDAVVICLEAVMDYARRLAERAERLARSTADPQRRQELLEAALTCRRCPAGPAESLQDALNSIWICFLALHQENMNAGLSIGRLDTWLQPYFDCDLKAAASAEEREQVISRALELVGAFMLKATDHLPLVADVGNRLFGGSSSDQVITLGGLNRDGSSAVCDMTYVFLKATEMLGLRDPNVNARYHPDINPDYYLRRLCEVNLITGATPSLHNDRAVLAALKRQGIPLADARDWGATGCVEPTICGRHMGHTNCMLLNMVAGLEMALHDGTHPLIGQKVGPSTGIATQFATFDAFYEAYLAQLGTLIDKAVEANNLLGKAHQALHPTPYLSSLIQGTMQSGRDVVRGGARYNSSGTAMVGLVDVVDSLVAIKHLVFDRKRCTMQQLLKALDVDFDGHGPLLSEILHRIPKFGDGDTEPGAMASRLIDFIFERFAGHENYRGGRYVPGYWSMSNHVAFGMLTGALPSGRQKSKAFTPGLTPSPLCEADLLDHIRQVAALDPEKMPNNIAFNVKLTPGGRDEHRQVVERMFAYARTYFELGGMQLQFNAVSSDTMRDAMEHPDAYRNLLVRISGYNAYFVELNREMQLELIERAEHR